MYFKELNALPVYGPLAVNFGTTGEQGFVVEFYPDDRDKSWTGNFRTALSTYSAAFKHPNDKEIVVIAGGDVYIVDPDIKTITGQFGGNVCQVIEFPYRRELLFNNYINLKLLNPMGIKWTTKRLAMEDLKIDKVENDIIYGHSFEQDDTKLNWQIDLNTGEHMNGYNCPWI